MKTNATTGIWRRTPQLDARFHELLRIDPKLSYTAIAQRLSLEFKITLTKNACIGHGRHAGVPKRQPPRSYAGRKNRKPKPYVAKIRLTPRFRPMSRPSAGRVPLEQLEPNDCRWPEGDRAPFLFCGEPRHGSSSYCWVHAVRSCPSLKVLS